MTTVTDIRLATRLRAARVGGWALRRLGDLGGELARPRTSEDPYPLFARVRAAGPLYRSRAGLWLTATYRTANAILRDRRFGVRNADGEVPHDNIATAIGGLELDPFVGLDPPGHTRLRRLLNPSFSAAAINRYRPRVERVVERVLDRVAGKDEFDLITEFAQPVPLEVITDVLGVPEGARERFGWCAMRVGFLTDQVDGLGDVRELRAILVELKEMFAELIELRRREPGDDVISSLVAASEREEIPTAEMVALCVTLLIAGSENAVNVIGNGVLALLRHPEQWRLLRERPTLAGAAVEETMRYDASTLVVPRHAHEDVEIEGRTVPANREVMVLIAGANRDPEAFTDPDRFDITRENASDHLTFAAGLHYCIGAPLSRVEGDVALRMLVERMPRLRLAGAPRYRRSAAFRGMSELPVAV